MRTGIAALYFDERAKAVFVRQRGETPFRLDLDDSSLARLATELERLIVDMGKKSPCRDWGDR